MKLEYRADLLHQREDRESNSVFVDSRRLRITRERGMWFFFRLRSANFPGPISLRARDCNVGLALLPSQDRVEVGDKAEPASS